MHHPKNKLHESTTDIPRGIASKTGAKGEGNYDPSPEGSKATFSFSAVFAEERVDPDLEIVRLNRFVGAYDCGRVIHPRTARSQAIGGIIWGVGHALTEQSETDPTLGRFVNRNYSGYLVPTCADIPDLDVLFVGEFDGEASPIGAKGLGELTQLSRMALEGSIIPIVEDMFKEGLAHHGMAPGADASLPATAAAWAVFGAARRWFQSPNRVPAEEMAARIETMVSPILFGASQ